MVNQRRQLIDEHDPRRGRGFALAPLRGRSAETEGSGRQGAGEEGLLEDHHVGLLGALLVGWALGFVLPLVTFPVGALDADLFPDPDPCQRRQLGGLVMEACVGAFPVDHREPHPGHADRARGIDAQFVESPFGLLSETVRGDNDGDGKLFPGEALDGPVTLRRLPGPRG
jgi:hypothetical protein